MNEFLEFFLYFENGEQNEITSFWRGLTNELDGAWENDWIKTKPKLKKKKKKTKLKRSKVRTPN